jgi:hypothetical protein
VIDISTDTRHGRQLAEVDGEDEVESRRADEANSVAVTPIWRFGTAADLTLHRRCGDLDGSRPGLDPNASIVCAVDEAQVEGH